MKKFTIFALATLLYAGAMAQEAKKEATKPEGYKFTVVKQVQGTPVKDQFRSGTCWSFSGIGFLENELIRTGKGEFDLSEMWLVRNCYAAKAEKYVRLQGNFNFAGGGGFFDLFWVMNNFGLVPEEAYPGLKYGEEKHVHGELDALTKAYVDVIVKNPNKKLSTAWKNGFSGILDAYLGTTPEKFSYKGKEYTPQSFAKELNINADDYVSLTSYTHHPFYKKMILEIPDNWLWEESYNLPLDELMQVVDNSLNNGYSIAWGADVSEKGFQYNKGVAVIPQTNVANLSNSEKSKWSELTAKERESMIYKLEEPVSEMTITQQMRQDAFDNYQTTDDHGMVLEGIAKDQKGDTFYIVKNSWSADGIYKGYFYASRPFVQYKTMNIMVHKNAIPKEIQKKLGIK
ncbi:aminopeptidase C [Alistipes sp. ZOR0009]|uniref:aminopeptidase C n=1 Tax=Alistipes sp. ZOR0009 TaxID=1339253 RepID=UPI000646AB6D|nr:C1 family peptidase [Alistipes sp. ZOR0009]